MKLIGKYLIIITLLQAVCGSYSAKATGFPILSMDHFTMYVMSFAQKMEKIAAYEKEINETKETINSLGSLDVNVAEKMLKDEISDVKEFADTVHFGDVASGVQGNNSKAFDSAAKDIEASASSSTGTSSTSESGSNSDSQSVEVIKQRSMKKEDGAKTGGK